MSLETIQRDTSRTLTVTPLLAILAMLVLFAAGCSDQQSSAPEQTQTTETPAVQVAEPEPEPMAPAEVPEPVAEVVEPVVTAAAGDGEPIYQKACKACHAAGVANAPKIDDKAAWAPRIAKGNDALFESVKNGFNAMPPMGGCMTCSDAELRSAIAYMTAQ